MVVLAANMRWREELYPASLNWAVAALNYTGCGYF